MIVDVPAPSSSSYHRPLPLAVQYIQSTDPDNMEILESSVTSSVTITEESTLRQEVHITSDLHVRSLSIDHTTLNVRDVRSRGVTSRESAARTCTYEDQLDGTRREAEESSDFTRRTLQAVREDGGLSRLSRLQLLAMLSLYKAKKLSHSMVLY